jgi:SAM-dependent methyltransferase
MHSILDAERQKYEDMWTVDAYASHSPGEMYAPLFLDMIGGSPLGLAFEHPNGLRVRPPYTILDAGCGSGKGALALHAAGFRILSMCDLTGDGLVPEARSLPFVKACLWEPLLQQVHFAPGGKFDYVYCCDVLEHIPTAFTMLVVSRLLEVARFGVFLSISFQPDVMGAWIGASLHETVQPFVWWRDNLNTVGRLVEGRDLLNTGVFLVKPIHG